MLVPLLWYVKYDDFSKFFVRSPSSGIMRKGIFYSVSDVVILSYSIPGTKYSPCTSQSIFRVSTGSVIFQSSH